MHQSYLKRYKILRAFPYLWELTMKKKHHLKLETEIDFKLLGIVTTLKDFEVAFHINKILSFSFRHHTKGLELKTSEDSRVFFYRVFQYKEENFKWNLINNKSTGKNNKEKEVPDLAQFNQEDIRGYLLEAYKQIDYLLQMPITVTNNESILIMKNLKKMSNITSVFMLDANEIQDAEYLIFE